VSLRILLPSVLLLAVTACAPKATTVGATDEAPARTTRDRSLITAEDLEADASLKAQSVLEVIRSLRPQFLINRGVQGTVLDDPEAGMVHASIDGLRIIDVKELAQTSASQILQVRLLNAGQAQQKFGPSARQGPVILVTTAKQ
jgi:hypothetical protein